MVAGPSGQAGIRINVRTAFTVEKTDDSFSNKARISLYNLKRSTRSILEAKNVVIALEVGYGEDTGVLFVGRTNADGKPQVKSERKGADLLTTIEAGDGELEIAQAVLDLSLSPGATNRQVVAAAEAALGLTLGVRRSLPEVRYAKGFAYSGRVKGLLDRLTRDVDYKWSVQNNEIQIVPRAEGTGEEAAFLSAETGLIGIPNKTEDGWSFVSLLNRKIAPGRIVRIQSRETGPGDFRVVKAVHEGDTHEGDWKTTVEGVPRGQ